MSADERLLYRYAEPIYRQFAEAGDGFAAYRVAELVTLRNGPANEIVALLRLSIASGEPYEERRWANRGRHQWIIRHLTEHGDLEDALAVLRAWADAGDQEAAKDWAELLIAEDRIEQADAIVQALVGVHRDQAPSRSRLGGVSYPVEHWFHRLLIEQDRTDAAMAVLHAFTHSCGATAADLLTEQLPPLHTHRAASMSDALRVFFPDLPDWDSPREEPLIEGWFDRLSGQDRAEEALSVLRALADAGSGRAARDLADILAEREALDELRDRADADGRGDRTDITDPRHHFDERLADLLEQREDVEALRARADAGSWRASVLLADLLARQDGIGELRERADRRDEAASKRLARLLIEQEDFEELRARISDGDQWAAEGWVRWLIRQDRTDDPVPNAVPLLRALAETDVLACNLLTSLLLHQQRTDEAITLLQTQFAAGNEIDGDWLADLLIEAGRTGEALDLYRTLAETDTWGYLTEKWARLLIDQDRIDQVVPLIQALNRFSSDETRIVARWADRLTERERIDDAMTVCQALSDAGVDASRRIAQLLLAQGRIEHLCDRADEGDQEAADLLTRVLAEHDALDLLREWADEHSWDQSAASRLATLLARHGHLDELRERADAGDSSATYQLAEALAEQGRLDELRERADRGDPYAALRLADVLAGQGRHEELREEVCAGTRGAGKRFIRLLEEDGDTEPAEQIRRFGLLPDGTIAPAS